MKTRLLLVDDQQSILYFLRKTLANEGYDVMTADRGDVALEIVRQSVPDVVLLDMKLPDTNGLDILRELRAQHPQVSVIMMTAFGDVQSSVEAMKLGAMDYLNKPVQLDELLDLLEAATARRLTAAPRAPLRAPSSSPLTSSVEGFAIPSQERAMHEVQTRALALVQSPRFLLLLEGEPGTGRGSLARWAHANSSRATAAFVAFAGGAWPLARHGELLFGENGIWQQARGGTLCIEHLDLLESSSQMQLALALDEHPDLGLIASSDAELWREAEMGRLRPELYAHFAAVRLRVPPLRRRRADILPLAEHFLREHAAIVGLPAPQLSESAKQTLLNHAWTGNIRELRSTLAAALLLSQGSTIESDQLVLAASADESGPGVLERVQDAIEGALPADGIDFENLIRDLERSLIEKAYRASDGNQSQTAKLLNLNRDKLRYRMKSFQLL